MKIERRRKSGAEVYTSSLNDIMFFLLLFFLIISTMVNPSVIRVLLPKASNTEQAMAKESINLTITKDGKYYLNNQEIQFSQIEALLVESLKKENTETTVFLRADHDLTLQSVVDVIDIGNKLQVKMVLSTEKK